MTPPRSISPRKIIIALHFPRSYVGRILSETGLVVRVVVASNCALSTFFIHLFRTVSGDIAGILVSKISSLKLLISHPLVVIYKAI